MVPMLKRFRLSFLIGFLLVAAGCDALPVDFFPNPPTLFPGISPIATQTSVVDQTPPTVPGFPTQPAIETQVLPSETQTAAPTLAPTETRRPPEASNPMPQAPTPRPEPFFSLQPGNPQPLVNIARPESGCNWMGIGGQIFDLQGNPLVNYLVQVEGVLANEPISVLALTGGTPQLGPGGYLLEIASQPVESSGMLYLHVLDLSGRVLSDKIFITTYSDCDKNLILANFSQLPPGMDNMIFLPAINKE